MKRSIYYCYTPIKPHQQLRHSLIFCTFFSLFKLFFSPILKKKIFFSPLIHTYCYIFYNIFPSFLSLYLPTTFNFTVTLSSPFLYFDYFSLHFILYKFDIIFLIQFIFFPPQNYEYFLSLFVDFCSFLYL